MDKNIRVLSDAFFIAHLKCFYSGQAYYVNIFFIAHLKRSYSLQAY